MTRRRRPIGQHREGLLAWTAEAPANPDLLVPLVMSLFKPPSVTNDGPVAAKRAHSGKQRERDLAHRAHPESILFSGSGSAIKRITAGVKAGH